MRCIAENFVSVVLWRGCCGLAEWRCGTMNKDVQQPVKVGRYSTKHIVCDQTLFVIRQVTTYPETVDLSRRACVRTIDSDRSIEGMSPGGGLSRGGQERILDFSLEILHWERRLHSFARSGYVFRSQPARQPLSPSSPARLG